jgi:Tol biopolymer transport system component
VFWLWDLNIYFTGAPTRWLGTRSETSPGFQILDELSTSFITETRRPCWSIRLPTHIAIQITPQVSGVITCVAISSDGKQLAFVVDPDPRSLQSDIYFSEVDGGGARKLLSQPGTITGIAFSIRGDSLLFVEARVFKNYSPIVTAHLHEMDLASLNLKTGEMRWLTEQRAYDMSDPIVDPRDGSVVIKKPGPRKDFARGIMGFELVRFIPENGHLANEQELNPNLSEFFESAGSGQTYRETDPIDSLYSPALDTLGRLYFTWATENPTAGRFDYQVYRWNPDTAKTERLTRLHVRIVTVAPSPEGQWLALDIQRWGAGPVLDGAYLYSPISGQLQQLPKVAGPSTH